VLMPIKAWQFLLIVLASALAVGRAAAFLPSSAPPRPRARSSRPSMQLGDLHRGSLPPMYTGPLPSRCRAIIFDIDGTLADSFQLAFSATNKVLKNNQYEPINDEQYHYGCRFTTPVRLATHTGLTPDAANFAEVGEKLGAEFDALYISMVDANTAGFYVGVKELINAIPPDVKIGALTNAAVAYAEAVLKANGVRGRFAAVHGADDVPKPKPAPDGILQCLQEMQCDAHEAVYIGDSPTDGRAALSAGCASVAVTWGANSPQKLAGSFDTICHSVDSLRAALLPPAKEPSTAPAGARHVLLDRDGVINMDVGSPGILAPSQLTLAPDAAETIETLKRRGCRVSLVTNQNSVGKGRLTLSQLYDIHEHLLQQLQAPGPSRAGRAPSPSSPSILPAGATTGRVDDIFVAVGVEKLSLGEDGGAGEREPAVLGARKFALKPGGCFGCGGGLGDERSGGGVRGLGAERSCSPRAGVVVWRTDEGRQGN
jgi:phosphoglycolate phosphatase-like HAD superfamily hydrolase